MDQGTKNYRQPWADDIVGRYRQAWNGELSPAGFEALFAPGLVLHLHDEHRSGADALAALAGLVARARQAAPALDLLPELVLARDGLVLLYHRWTAERWHPDVVGGGAVSNYCKLVLRVEHGRIAEWWQQAPDFLFLLGKLPIGGPMRYPSVVEDALLLEDADGIRPTDDEMTRQMSGLFRRMNDCFMNRASLREMHEIQNDDLEYDTGTLQGRGVQSWKTFAYALHTCLGGQRGTRFDDLYVRRGDRLRVFLRATPDAPSPQHLQCADGLVASMSMTVRGGRIQSLKTRIENYVQFLDTDFTRHQSRLRALFQGRREPVQQARAGAAALPLRPGPGRGVAIVGMAGRFPQCDSVDELWQALSAGRTLVSPVPEARPQLQGRGIGHAGFIDGIEQFDAAYFRVLPEEAAHIDPQQRLLMQEVVHAMEDSGHAPATFAGARTGLFVATLCEDHQKLLQECGRLDEPRSWAGNENAMFPAKLARHFDIQGPCRFVNAECTSALVALHEAAALIRAGEIDQAIVGASNLLLHPYGFAVRRDALLTDEPAARLFGKDSRGQVRGEAIVAVVLKALPCALEDGDRIHGLLAGSAVNNSGRTLSLVAGHVPQQARAITDAWRAAGVDGSRVSLIECHASGVRGGDFAEVAAVRQAFGALPGESRTDAAAGADGQAADAPPACRLATAKGATGHAEAASGLVSLVKVLLQMRHGQVLAVHGMGEPDPDLPFDPPRFGLATTTAPWPAPAPGRPRVAGINAFAAGGYNAHVVIEQHLAAPAQAPAPAGPQAVVLSSASASGLAARLRDLRRWLGQGGAAAVLADLAASSQRREVLKHRAAFVVDHIGALPPLIDALLDGTTLPPGAFASAHASAHASAQASARADGAARATGPVALPAPGQPVPWADIAAAWCAGQAVDWTALARRTGGRLLPDLPGTPFEGRRFWLPDAVLRAAPARAAVVASSSPSSAAAASPASPVCMAPNGPAVLATGVLHPLLHENVSRPGRQRYRSRFSGDEAVLADHRVLGRRLLPGVAVLEMVRAAAADAWGADGGEGAAVPAVQLASVVWLRPITVDAGLPRPLEVHVDLRPVPDDAGGALLAFEVGTQDADGPRLHCQGLARRGDATAAPVVELAALRAAHRPAAMDPARLYAAYAALGIDYGPSYRAVAALFERQDAAAAPAVLAELLPPAGLEPGCALPTALLDAAVHAAMALLAGGTDPAPRQPPLPFALESVRLLHPCSPRMWAHIRHAAAAPDAAGQPVERSADGVRKLDIDLLDGEGRTCVRLAGLSLRSGDKPVPRPRPAAEAATAAPADAPAPAAARPAAPADALRARVLAELKDQVAALLQVSADEVDPHEELSQYGFDSINLTEFGNRLNERYRLPTDQPLNPTIFFEHPTLAGFSGHLVTRYREAIEAATGLVAAAPVVPPPLQAAPPVPAPQQGAEPVPAAQQTTAPGPAQPAALPVVPATPTSPPARDPAAALPPPAAGRGPADIAIVGISGRFPMAEGIDAFWRNLEAGRDCISEVPAERWDWRALFGHPQKEPHKTDVRWGGFIDGVAEFDPLFFGISPREAELMDPQHRLLMQHAWQAIEDAGTDPRSLAGSRTGVFLATASSGYAGLLLQSGHAVEGSSITGTVPSVGPNRISYFLGLHGPSEPIETACSSSLVAIHRAIVAMQAGTCDAALVGGVNTVVTPEGHIGFRRAGMLCEDGRCKTFSRQANGYVRGEGVGVLYLRRLADAERDGDPVYAVIRGSAENHGGRASSLTAPNPKAQAELVLAAHRQAGIDPRSIGYIEAHGTGTELGDPIEVNGLKSAFAERYREIGAASAAQPHCGLGSVKSNIGHLELAAGVAGVIKVLMQLRHRRLARSLHSDDPNPYLQLEGSPFYVVQQARPWDAPRDAAGHTLPRRAGVSAFGFGGANAHVVLEEHPQAADVAPEGPPGMVLVPLSARTRPQLREVAQRLLQALRDGQHHGRPITAQALRDVAYTLQVGRAAMDERAALVAASLDELVAGLEALAGGADRAPNLYVGATRTNREAMAIFQDDEELAAAVAAWMARGKLHKVAELWVKGLALDWQGLYAAGVARPRRISLPAYPFARERCWVPAVLPAAAPAGAARLHPLVHDNVSDFASQRYRTRLQGGEFFLRDHVALGRPVLPAVAYLEMVRAALADASHAPVQRLGKVLWLAPMVAEPGQVLDVRVELALRDGGEVGFQVRTAGPGGAEPRLHCQGVAMLQPAAGDLAPARPLDLDALDLDALRGRCAAGVLGADAVYAAFESMGLHYGPGHRAVAALHLGSGGTPELLARLQLPAALQPALDDYLLHPSLMDGALQSAIGLLWRGGEAGAPATGGRPMLPFHLKSLEPLAPCQAAMWAWVRPSPQAAADPGVQALDIDLCDDGGGVCVRLRGLLSRALPAEAAQAAGHQAHMTMHEPKLGQTDGPTRQTLLLAPVAELLASPPAVPAPAQRTLVLAADAGAAAALRRACPGATVIATLPADARPLLDGIEHCVWAAPDAAPQGPVDEDIVGQQERGVFALFRTVKALLAQGQGPGHGAPALSFTVLTSGCQQPQAPDPTHAGAIGLAGSLAKEMPAWRVRSIDLPSGWSRQGAAVDGLLREALALPCVAGGSAWARHGDGWAQHKLALRQVVAGAGETRPRDSAYRMHGVYVVIGGAGGLGEVWTDYMVRTYQAQVVWIGRRAEDDALRDSLDRLGRAGPRPLYVRADASQRASLAAARDTIRQRFPRIHGVVHAAAVLQDGSLAQMDEAGLRTVLAAKVDTSVCMAQVFAAEALDFVLFFSSLVAFGRPPGQANYVAGCAFTDAFALRLARDWPCAVKVMNWGFWGGVGVAAAPALEARMARLGIGSVAPAEAMEALELLLGDPDARCSQLALVTVTRPLAELARSPSGSFLALPAPAAQPLAAVAGQATADAALPHAVIVTAATPRPPQAQHAAGAAPAAKEASAADAAAAVEAHAVATITRILAQALKVDAAVIDVDEPFTGYGLDSITGVHLAQTLNETFGIDVDVTLFFDHGTVRRLAAHLLREHHDALARACAPAGDAAAAPAPAGTSATGAAYTAGTVGTVGTAPAVPTAPAASTAATASLTPAGSRFRPAPAAPAGPVDLPAAGGAPGTANTANPANPAAVPADDDDVIAIVGLSAAFAGAPDAETFWRNQLAGVDSVTAVPVQRWDWQQVSGDPAQSFDRQCFQWGGFLDGIDTFDADFFGITPEEAAYMSPQQRLLLTHAWRALEDAAIAPRDLRREPTGVFVATVPSEYLNTVSDPKDVPLMVTGLSTSMIPSRISHSLDLHGPSELCDTACSSTLVALHRAVQAMRHGECRQAIVGAVNLLLTPTGHIGFEAMGYLSASGRMAAFQAEADGFVRAEGVGAVVLKPLRRALADGNRIQALIRGIGVAHGGHTISMTTPNGSGMREAIRQALEPGRIDPRSIAYVEAHGTASALGDAIEFTALKGEYQRLASTLDAGTGRVERQQVGSAKPGIGYPEVASGMAALVRVVMALRDRVLPGTAGFTRLHDNLAGKTGPFHFTAENAAWPARLDAAGRPLPRRAAVNNYGFSGVNAHLVLEEHLPAAEPAVADAGPPAPAELVVLSARSAPALLESARRLAHAVETQPGLALADIAFTLQHGREPMEHRLAVVAADRAQLLDALRAVVAAGETADGDAPGVPGVWRGVAARTPPAAAGAQPQEAPTGAPGLAVLARQWVAGAELPQLHPPARRARRIALPGHPLAAVSHWVEGGTGMAALHGAAPRAPRRARGPRAAGRPAAAAPSHPSPQSGGTLDTTQEST